MYAYALECFNAARGFVGGAAFNGLDMEFGAISGFNAARGFVGGAAILKENLARLHLVSMPHAALWVVQLTILIRSEGGTKVSMPHAALWVVQLRRSQPLSP